MTEAPLDFDALFGGVSDASPSAPAAREFYTDLPWYPDLMNCTACACRAEAQRVVPGEGPVTATVAFIGRNPGKDEDRLGSPFVGKAGLELTHWIEALGMSRARVLVANLVKCHTTADRPPSVKEVQTCGPKWLREELLAYDRVQVIFALGDEVSRFMLGVHAPSVSKCAFTPLRVRLDDTAREFLVIPTPHPAYILRKPSVRQSALELLRRAEAYLRAQAPEAYARSR